jgi:hypothetical protein
VHSRNLCSGTNPPGAKSAASSTDGDITTTTDANTTTPEEETNRSSSDDSSDSRSDLQIHLDYMKEAEIAAGRGGGSGEEKEEEKGSGLLFDLQHPLLRKYNFDVEDFSTGASDAVHSVFRAVHTNDFKQLSDGLVKTCPSLLFLKEVCSDDAIKTMRRVEQGGEGIQDVHARIEGDLQWFNRFGLQLSHDLHVHERQLAFAHLTDVKLHLSRSRAAATAVLATTIPAAAGVPAADSDKDSMSRAAGGRGGTEGIDGEAEEEQKEEDKEEDEGGEEGETHVMAVVNTVFQLRSEAAVHYYLPGPPQYDLKVS